MYKAQRSKTLHVNMIIVYSYWSIISLDWITYMLYSLLGYKNHWLLNVKLLPIRSFAFPTSSNVTTSTQFWKLFCTFNVKCTTDDAVRVQPSNGKISESVIVICLVYGSSEFVDVQRWFCFQSLPDAIWKQ